MEGESWLELPLQFGISTSKHQQDWLAWLLKRDKGAEKEDREKIGQNSCKTEAKIREGAWDGKVENWGEGGVVGEVSSKMVDQHER